MIKKSLNLLEIDHIFGENFEKGKLYSKKVFQIETFYLEIV